MGLRKVSYHVLRLSLCPTPSLRCSVVYSRLMSIHMHLVRSPTPCLEQTEGDWWVSCLPWLSLAHGLTWELPSDHTLKNDLQTTKQG